MMVPSQQNACDLDQVHRLSYTAVMQKAMQLRSSCPGGCQPAVQNLSHVAVSPGPALVMRTRRRAAAPSCSISPAGPPAAQAAPRGAALQGSQQHLLTRPSSSTSLNGLRQLSCSQPSFHPAPVAQRCGIRPRTTAAAAAAVSQGPWEEGRGPVGSLTKDMLPQVVHMLSVVWALLQRIPPVAWVAGVLRPAVQLAVQYRGVLGRLAATVGLLAVIRCGLYIPLPGVDFSRMPATGLMSEGERLMRALYGQAAALPASLFELGISPQINASILISMVLSMPDIKGGFGPLQRLRDARKEGRSGQAYIEGYINGLALFFAVWFGLHKAIQLQQYALLGSGGPFFLPTTALALVAGACITQYCARLITATGLANGPSVVICAGIATDFGEALHSTMSRLEAGTSTLGQVAPLMGGYLLLALATVYLSRTALRLPILQYNRTSAAATDLSEPAPQVSRDDVESFAYARAVAEAKMRARSKRSDFFPIPINSNGMMSVILAGVFWFQALPAAAELCNLTALHSALLTLQEGWGGLLVYGLLVFLVEFLPLGSINPKEVAEYFGALNVGIRGVVPGEPTEAHIQAQMLRCKFWGGLAMGVIAVAASVYDIACMRVIGASLSATSLLIIVGTIMQSSKQVEGLLEGPRLAARLKREQDQIDALRAI